MYQYYVLVSGRWVEEEKIKVVSRRKAIKELRAAHQDRREGTFKVRKID